MRPTRTLAGRLFLWQLSVVLFALLGVGLVLDRVLEHDAVDSLTRSLISEARTIERALPPDPALLEGAATRLGQAAGVRVTVIRTDGVVLADSEHDPSTMQNHKDRPEVQEALAGQVGTASRVSATLGIPFQYVALPAQNGLIVRVAVPLTEVESRRATVRTAVVAGLLVAAVATSLGSLIVSRWISRPLRATTASLERLGEGDLSVRVKSEAGPLEFAVLASTVNRMAESLEEQVRASDEERRTRDLILSSMEEGILLAAPDGIVRFSNPTIERLFGNRPQAVADLGPVALRVAAQRAVHERAPVGIDVETGAPARSLVGAAIPVDEEGSVLIVIRDITEAKRLEAVRKDFVANASHELKTPAASIQAAAETIGKAITDDPGVVPRFAKQLERDAVRLSRIVSDLLDLSRLETGSELDEIVQLDALINEEVSRFEAAAADAAISLSVRAEPSIEVRGSPRDLALLVRNLIDNAIQYTKPAGSVDVALSGGDAEAVLRVTDTGIGIPSRDLPRVFERFYRVDRARSRETGGTGLGLSIVRHVVENHGGTVAVSSELGRGTTFEVHLPASLPASR